MPEGEPTPVTPETLSSKWIWKPPLPSWVITATKWIVPVKSIVSPVHGFRTSWLSGTRRFCKTAADEVVGTSQSAAARNGRKQASHVLPLEHPWPAATATSYHFSSL